jgi:2,4-diketo-3-deoxy-L-fuconate hydrolase
MSPTACRYHSRSMVRWVVILKTFLQCLPGFTQLGPWIRPAAEVDPGDLRLRSWVNGEARQDSSTSDLIFSVAEIIVQLSQAMAFEPGDVILTGTPQGVALSGKYPYLADGDVVELELEGLGRHRQVVTIAE